MARESKTMSDDIVRKILNDIEHNSEREDSLRRMIASARSSASSSAFSNWRITLRPIE